MQKTILLGMAALLSAASHSLAQTSSGNELTDSPFVRNIRPDRPGVTITTNMLYPGQVQVDAGIQQLPESAALGRHRTLSAATLRIGFFNHIELRATQGYLHQLPRPATGETSGLRSPSGFAPLTVGAKFLASTVQNARSQVVVLAEMTLPNGDASYLNKTYEPSARLLISQLLGQRYGLEGNFGFKQRGFRAADTKVGEYTASVALNGPLGGNFGFFTEAYALGRFTWRKGVTTGVYWRPSPGIRFDVTAGHQLNNPGLLVGTGLSMRLPK
ncbi:transporter [Hymenobacter lutimineralis]|uniref:Transporter n=1 Tax=Hymenobacter lutimineralis TaxID=2606448 RepID=A0A5D6V6L6_9BACT|nr:transporter [Hymenobacter lutimineralis]TYZ10489.1 transporter [Hymenobacter lutimineralis]